MQTFQQLVQALDALAIDAGSPPKYRVMVARQYARTSLSAVRPKHALDTLSKADAITILEHEGPQFFIATKRMKTRKGEWEQVVVGIQVEDEREILAGFRLFADVHDLSSISTPTQAFAAVLEHYGVPFKTTEGESVRFTALVTAPSQRGESGAGMLTDLNEVMEVEPVEHQALNATVKPVDGVLRARWPFLVDTRLYGADIAAYQK
jgi:hypothetical protein